MDYNLLITWGIPWGCNPTDPHHWSIHFQWDIQEPGIQAYLKEHLPNFGSGALALQLLLGVVALKNVKLSRTLVRYEMLVTLRDQLT